MRLIKNFAFIAFSFLLLFNVSTYGQNINKIDKKLSKPYHKGQFEKTEKKAKKLKKKYPRLDVVNFYLAKVEMVKFNDFNKTPDKKQYKHLKKATSYSKKLSNEYTHWNDSLKLYHKNYIKSWNDNNYESAYVKKLVLAYAKAFNDTLPAYYKYYPRNKISTPELAHDIPITDSLRTHLITFASELVGIPYFYSGEKPEDGFDCSGFVKYVYSSIAIELPHNAHMQSQLEGEIIKLEDAEPGDLIFFGSGNTTSWRTQHAGIIFEYTDDEPKVIHCVSRGVSIDGNNTSWDHYWKERILFVKRLPQLQDE